MPDSLIAPNPHVAGQNTWTRREIIQQPAMLRATQQILLADSARIEAFLAPLLANPQLRIMLCGAGTSAFIGQCLAPWLSAVRGRPFEAIATTDIVGAPQLVLAADRPTLMVSFGRSGNSPESLAAADLADAHIATVHHLIITCNADGALARRAGPNALVVVLPEATHDRAFAMTSSFTAMMLAALSVFGGISSMTTRVDAIADTVAATLVDAEPMMRDLAVQDFERIVFLGSGVFAGLAREAALKLLELTDGAIPTLYDTALGFRHGPKTIVTARTLVVVFVSNDPLTRLYDQDIIDELRGDDSGSTVIAIAAQPLPGTAAGNIVMVGAGSALNDADLLFPYIVPAQWLGLHCSVRLGKTPDQPNASGTVNRVVQGVRIHQAPA